jgi:DNA-binding transcriptional regulator YdaS (Cro superfamily)
MKLSEYVKANPGSIASLARLVGVSEATVSRWSCGLRSPRPKNARLIESVTDGQVTKAELRPDIWG